ncbi:MAG: T9SS type A sorting domain-containing protein [Flavobacteriales bacterium]|nr:T9SS type A sorting domain-containing protein [Flavobacteriales bacterium]
MKKGPAVACALAFALAGYAQFGPQQIIEFNEARRPLAQVVLDVDGDGDPDLVASLQNDSRIVWYANEGAGAFAEQQVLVPNATYINNLIVLDLDADGLLDLAGTSLGPDRVLWWRNLGWGAFGPEQLIAQAGNHPRCLMAMDVDGDALVDFMVGTQYDGTIQWTRNLGGGLFAAMSVLDTPGPGIASLAKGDLDGDLREDILFARHVGTTAELAWYSNYGNGLFSARQVVFLAQDTLQMAGIADLNNDGQLDLFTSSYSNNMLVAFFNDGSGGFPSPTIVDSGAYDHDNIIAADMDQDDVPDLVYSTRLPYSLRWSRNEGDGSFSPGGTLATTLEYVRSINVKDLDGDGLPDVSYCSYTDDRIAFHRNLDNGQFGPQQEVTTQVDGASWVSAGDLNDDGRKEVLCASATDHRISWYMNLGNGQFAAQRTISNTLYGTRCVIAGDIDGDGDRDVIATSRTMNSILVFLNDGAGEFSDPAAISNSANQAMEVMAADLDLDGDLDLVVWGISYLAYHLNNGSGGFGDPVALTGYLSGDVPFDLADLDGDGLLDVVHVSSGFSRLAWFRNLGDGAFSSQIVISENVSTGPMIKTADIDRDGDIDVVLGSQPMRWYRNNGNGSFSPITFGSENGESDAMVVYDVDGDSYADVITARHFLNQMAMYRNLGNGTFGPRTVIPSSFDGPMCLNASNLDLNAPEELLCASWWDNKLFWHRNYFGSHFRAEGRRFIDLDLDGAAGPDEPGMSWGQLTCTPYLTYALTTINGEYHFSLDSGAYQIASAGAGAWWDLVTTPAAYSVGLTDAAPVASGLDFGYAANVDTSLVVASIVIGNGPCGTTAPLWLNYANQGTRVEQGTITLQLDAAMTLVASVPPPANQAGNLFTWTFDSLGYFEVRSIALHVTRPGLASMGTTVNSTVAVTTLSPGGSVTGSFQASHTETVTCAYDPNDKIVEPSGYGEVGAIPITTDALEYTIRFQNTGTATAWNVELRDQLANPLDRSQFEVTGFSHAPTQLVIEPNGRLVVRFNNIMLPDSGANPLGSQGFFRFRIGIQEGLGHMTTITNTADIVFDINPAIVTNSTTTTLVDCALWNPQVTLADVDLLEASPGMHHQWLLNGEPLAGANGQFLEITFPGAYACEVMSAFGCTSTSADLTVLSTSVSRPSAEAALVLPNPFDDLVRIVLSQPMTTAHTLMLVDVHGSVAREWQVQPGGELLINRGQLSSGVYTLMISSNEGPRKVLRIVAR